ncbi:NAD-dependent malic enzyme [Aggregicoccus sp. 17bor-14]|uniref:NAD-dependent malic enzyme n=1 Tax=Myxococcaceae TaxID=31 RepID=UPI00129CD83F|nr:MULTISPECIES: NAD-dependent malic enzyme [Myxococcaceae]MBF5045807.1 NAD-dependent malic enzyme [Simulacricoccus sp. 17bor-14]MRI91542.1 NAD-dependent malic enzyme [Aggregicoccus sp. 17bor-14]
MTAYEKKHDSEGRSWLETSLPGHLVARHPLLNKGTSFTLEERKALGLMGLLPPRVETLEEQLARCYAAFETSPTALQKHVYLRTLQDSSEVLFYALVERHIEEMMPVIYTPTVAQGVEQFSRLWRTPRGLVVSPENVGQLDAMLAELPQPEVQLVVATDSEGILGIGDQGYGGQAICIGKLSLYTAAAGIDPALALPVVLDVGTNRTELIEDPLYLGVRRARMEGPEYDALVDAFVAALRRRFPNALLQWEDFSKQKAFDVLERHRGALPSFNDDIQGTGAVVLSGLIAAGKRTGRRLSDEVVLVHGAGAGGVGVARQVVRGMQREGTSAEEARRRIFLLDSKGLILTDRKGLEPYKREFAQDPARVADWKRAGAIPSLLETVQGARVTVLLGLSGQRGAFGEDVVRAAAAHTPTPLVFALSNPTANTEALPEDVLKWTEGRALVATGSPFPNVRLGDTERPVGQGNNAFIFPGLGQAVLLSRARQVTDGMLVAASVALAEFLPQDRLQLGALYPRMSSLRAASRSVALAVLRQAQKDGVTGRKLPDDLEGWLEKERWKPEFLPVRRAK